MVDMLDDRESTAPADELAEITGIRTGNSQPPEDDTDEAAAAGLLSVPQAITRPARPRPKASTARCAACTSRASSTPNAKRRNDFCIPFRSAGGKFELIEEDAQAWASAVNDVRLALGTMLDIGADGLDHLPPDHPMAGHLDVYQWLTVLQEYLVLGMMGPMSARAQRIGQGEP